MISNPKFVPIDCGLRIRITKRFMHLPSWRFNSVCPFLCASHKTWPHLMNDSLSLGGIVRYSFALDSTGVPISSRHYLYKLFVIALGEVGRKLASVIDKCRCLCKGYFIK